MEHEVVASRRLVRAVLDTSSLVSPRLRRDLQEAAHLEMYVGIWSPWIIAELNRVLVWRWIERKGVQSERECSRQAKAMMEILLPSFELVPALPPYPPAWETLSDRWDHPIWAAAKEGNAQYVISANTLDFPPRNSDGRHVHEEIEYLPGHAFLGRLAKGIE